MLCWLLWQYADSREVDWSRQYAQSQETWLDALVWPWGYYHACLFKKLESVSRRLQHLTSLQHLIIWKCPEIKDLPEELLPSLFSLDINRCTDELEEKTSKRGVYWPLISYIYPTCRRGSLSPVSHALCKNHLRIFFFFSFFFLFFFMKYLPHLITSCLRTQMEFYWLLIFWIILLITFVCAYKQTTNVNRHSWLFWLDTGMNVTPLC